MERYEHSGAVPITGVLTTLGAGLVAACLVGVVYSYLIVYIPFVYINFFVTAGFGAVLGFAAGGGAVVGKLRNTFVAGFLGLVVGLLGLYVAWAADPMARVEGGKLTLDPRILLRYMRFGYENGFWALRGGDNVKGIFLAVIWLVEAGMIVGLATLLAKGLIAGRAFCERCNQWTTLTKDARRLLVSEGQEGVVERALEGEIAALDELVPPEGSEPSYLRIDLATCPACTDSNFLTLQMVSQAVNKKGETSTNEVVLLYQVAISQADVQRIRGAGA